ncbi:MAG: DNA translocase FtsK 4TM domain-containing protein, partial [Pseudoxanthomonas sp.]
MAKQVPETSKAKGANSAARKQASVANPRRQRLWRDLALIAIAPLLLYLLASLFTYSPDDPSWSQSGSLTAPIHNLGGRVGAWVADMLLYLCGYV